MREQTLTELVEYLHELCALANPGLDSGDFEAPAVYPNGICEDLCGRPSCAEIGCFSHRIHMLRTLVVG